MADQPSKHEPKPRIKIDDLPLDEELSEDELKRIFGGVPPLARKQTDDQRSSESTEQK